MDAEIKEFIEKHIDLIDHGEFEELYRKLEDRSEVMALTETLLSADIDPARYMKEIPERYLQASTIRSYTIPNNVVTIGEDAFAFCSGITSIVIPEGVTLIHDRTFQNCTNLTQITLPSSVIQISSEAFLGCFDLKSINYLGTKKQWEKIKKEFNWKKGTFLREIKCTDGIIKFPEA